jgi:hypothetical protein
MQLSFDSIICPTYVEIPHIRLPFPIDPNDLYRENAFRLYGDYYSYMLTPIIFFFFFIRSFGYPSYQSQPEVYFWLWCSWVSKINFRSLFMSWRSTKFGEQTKNEDHNSRETVWSWRSLPGFPCGTAWSAFAVSTQFPLLTSRFRAER